jgi:CheY-like chemotaxis protein
MTIQLRRQPQHLQGRRVLIVEDQYLIADEMRRSVEALGGAVVGPAPSVEKAIGAMGEQDIDLALLDVNLSGEPVYRLADMLISRGTPFIFATGYARAALREDYADAPHIEKPVTVAALRSCLRTLGLEPPGGGDDEGEAAGRS